MTKKIYTVFALCIWTGALLLAQSPFLDNTFGVNGRFTHKFTEGFDRLWCTALQPDGKILGGGHSETSNGGQRASLLRTNPNGTLDTTFANGGEWISDDPSFGFVTKIIVQPDGKILLSGNSLVAFKVARLTPDGKYDFSFGTWGRVSVPVWNTQEYRYISDMLLQPNGKILISGALSASGNDMVTRIRADGSVDASFGTFGTIMFPDSLSGSAGIKLGLKSDNKILVAFDIIEPGGFIFGRVLQYSVNGTRDLTFAGNGVAKSSTTTTGVFVLPDDSFYLLSDYYDNNLSTGLYKFNSNGIRDSSFAVNGVGVLPYISPNLSSNESSESGYLQADGKMVVFGGKSNGVGYLGRFDENGFPDTSFGNNGTIAPETSFEIFYQGFAQPDGKIVAVGRFQDTQGNSLCSILRYLGSNSVGVIDAPATISSPLIYPNPINGQTFSIAYELPTSSLVEVEMLDIQGKMLRTLLNDERPAGKNEESLDLPTELTNGVYLLNIRTNRGNSVVKLIVQR